MLKVAYIRSQAPTTEKPRKLSKKQQYDKEVKELGARLKAKWEARDRAAAEKKYGVKLP